MTPEKNGQMESSASRKGRFPRWLVISLFVLSAFVLFAIYLFSEMMGMGGWQPDKTSVYAERARGLDRRLQNGMTRVQVKKLFADDISVFPKDVVEDTHDAYEGKGIQTWAIETDLSVFEPRPHFWNSFDTMWTVRTRFDQDGTLIEHKVQLSDCCGP